ncbi:cyclase family protein [Eubacteriales bacterium OttesenSCG-928-K08]|nr:cyclase family protein [Eubacteriales bacterium OttesenSCG-928-K08]
MANADLSLWDVLANWKTNCNWVDLSHTLSPKTPHWHGFNALSEKILFDFDNAPFKTFEYTTPGQYGTHVDVPSHFDPEGRPMDQIDIKEMVYPLCVIDKSDACALNADYALTIDDVREWENTHGKIPEGALVAFRSDWYKRDSVAFENRDKDGNAHYPGWEPETIKWLVEERNIGSIGHEPPDTDPAALQHVSGFAGEEYILKQDRVQFELLKNLDLVPATGAIAFCMFPKLEGGTGFSMRCMAICPK